MTRSRIGAVGAAALVAAVLGGCIAEVRQDAYGQHTTNSPTDAVTITQRPVEFAGQDGKPKVEFVNTMTSSGRATAVRETLIDERGVETRGNNEVRTDQTIVLPDGTRITNISGKDVVLDSLVGTKSPDGTVGFDLRGLRASASEPIRAQNEGLIALKDILVPLYAEQGDLAAAAFDSIRAGLSDALKAAFGIP